MTTRTAHHRSAAPSVRLYELSTEQGTTHLWSRSADDARWTAWSHDLLPGLTSQEDLAVSEVGIDDAGFAADSAAADRHIARLYAPHYLRDRAAA